MIFGGVDEDRIQYNEQTLWTGGPRAYERQGAVKYLQPIRQLLFDGKQSEAEALAEKHFMGMKSNEITYTADSARWVEKMRNMKVKQAADFNENVWKPIALPTAQGWETTPGFEGLDGAVWLRTTFELPAGWKGKNLVLSLGRIRDLDITYINGNQVGATSGTAYRKYIIPANKLHTGKNLLAIQVLNFNDKGGLTSAAKEMLIYPEGFEATAIKGRITSSEITTAVDKDGDVVTPVKLSGTWKYRIQNDNPPAYPRYNADYQPFADLYLQFPKQEITNYKRDLDLTNATAHVTYKADGVNYTREYGKQSPIS
jgi:alpha-L-fucosidase 2